MNNEEICYMSAWEMADKIKAQELTSQEITEILIERIEKINPIINAYCTPTFDLARKMAKNADERIKKGQKIPPLNGIPVSIKDLMPVKGVRTTQGSKIYENYIPDEDSITVKRLRKAGCVILGKTNTPEFGFKGVTDNEIFGVTPNPWNLERTSGGSSGGAAASVACGMGPLAQGSDGGGSIRHPACFCGIFGLKPTFGRVPRSPGPIKSYIDTELSVIGPIVRYVSDAALMLDVMKGPFEGDRFSLPDENINYADHVNETPEKLKIGYSLDLGFVNALDPDVEKAVKKSVFKFQTYGWDVEEVKFEGIDPSAAFSIHWLIAFGYNTQPYLDEWQDKLDPTLVTWVKAGLDFPASSLPSAMKKRTEFYNSFYETFKNYDILVTPTTAIPAFELGTEAPREINGIKVGPTGWQPFTFPINFTGHPASTIPCGWSGDGLPIGMQIIGKRFQELLIFQVSRAFEDIAPWQDKKPTFN
ncbi:MAG: amidase [Promethearchaeota archaeon]|jgi:Asp-tRNA(Asn)/Glu-tRNA(Gln) amidotransferase A subunit family amidase